MMSKGMKKTKWKKAKRIWKLEEIPHKYLTLRPIGAEMTIQMSKERTVKEDVKIGTFWPEQKIEVVASKEKDPDPPKLTMKKEGPELEVSKSEKTEEAPKLIERYQVDPSLAYKEVEFTIKCQMRTRWIPYFVSMLQTMENYGRAGHSAVVGLYSDGDGDFRPHFELHGVKAFVNADDVNRTYDITKELGMEDLYYPEHMITRNESVDYFDAG